MKYYLSFFISVLIIHVTVAHAAKLKVGDKAPAFSLYGDDGKVYSLSDYRGKKVVLCFYPRDNSYWCTKQACSISNSHNMYQEHDITIFGVNHASISSHAAFKTQHNLSFTLLSDPSCNVIKAYGAYSPLFTKRLTVFIDNEMVVAILYSIDVHNHAEQILRTFGVHV